MAETDYGLKASIKGFDISNCKDYQLLFSSSFPSLKIHSMGSFTISDTTKDQTLATHSLTYKPLFYIFFDRENIGDSAAGYRLAGYIQTGKYCGVNTQYLKWLGATRTAGAGSLNGYYYLFRRDMDTSYTATSVDTGAGAKVEKDDYGIKISRAGKDISSTDYRDFIVHTNCQSPMIHMQGSGTQTLGGADITITHNLGYQPMFIWYIYDTSAYADGYYSIFLAGADDAYSYASTTQLSLHWPYASNYRYVIYKDPLLLGE